MTERCAATHPTRYHRCRLRAGHQGTHRDWYAGRNDSAYSEWDDQGRDLGGDLPNVPPLRVLK